MTSRINLISGPRNISTALMYSFAQRADTGVVDEPLYAHYLRISGADHPGREEILAAQDQDGNRVIKQVMLGPSKMPVLFFKNMAHHLQQVDLQLLKELNHVLLIRHPEQIIASYAQVRSEVTIEDIGLEHQWRLYKWLVNHTNPPVIVDSADILNDPERLLSRLCNALSLDPDPAMLNWTPGPRPEDGIWAKYWYGSVHQSSGFRRRNTSGRAFPESCRTLLNEAMPIYDRFSLLKLS